jgi:hypothetical protein
MIFKTTTLITFLTAALQLTTSLYAQSVTATPTQPVTPKVIAHKFAYAVGKTETVTQAKDSKDEW